ncbi:MAG: DUF3772 domain-containing protein [Pseudomonadota bacterium]
MELRGGVLGQLIRIAFGLLAALACALAPARADDAAVSGARAEIAAEAERLPDLEAAVKDAEDADLEGLRDALAERRARLDAIIERLEAVRPAAEAAAGPADGLSSDEADDAGTPDDGAADDGAAGDEAGAEPDADDAEAAARTALAEAVDAAVVEARRVRGRVDRLAADVAARRWIAERQIAVDDRRNEIGAIEKALNEAGEDADLVDKRGRLRALRAAAQEEIAPVVESRDAIAKDLGDLGDPPAEDAPPEALELQQKRAALNEALLREDALVRQSTLNVSEIDRLLEEIAAQRRERFYGQIFSRGRSPIEPALLGAALDDFLAGVGQILVEGAAWHAEKVAAGEAARAYGAIAFGLLLGVILFGPTRRWINRRLIASLEKLEPTPGRRAVVAVLRVAARLIPGILGGTLIMQALIDEGAVTAANAAVARNIWFGFLALLAVDAGAAAVFSPSNARWGLAPLTPTAARVVRGGFIAFVAVLFADRTLGAGAEVYGGGQELAVVQSALVAMLMAMIYFGLARRTFWRPHEEAPALPPPAPAVGPSAGTDETADAVVRSPGPPWTTIRRSTRVIAMAIVAAALFGYVALAHYVATRMFMLEAIAALGVFVRLIGHEALRALDQSVGGDKPADDEETPQERMIFFWLGAFLDLVIILALAPLAFLALGAEWQDVRHGVADALFGFKIGDFEISLAKIATAIGVFIVILTVTRFVQRTGERQFFPRTRLDSGVPSRESKSSPVNLRFSQPSLSATSYQLHCSLYCSP